MADERRESVPARWGDGKLFNILLSATLQTSRNPVPFAFQPPIQRWWRLGWTIQNTFPLSCFTSPSFLRVSTSHTDIVCRISPDEVLWDDATQICFVRLRERKHVMTSSGCFVPSWSMLTSKVVQFTDRILSLITIQTLSWPFFESIRLPSLFCRVSTIEIGVTIVKIAALFPTPHFRSAWESFASLSSFRWRLETSQIWIGLSL